jgi:hypothetical protein
MASLEVKERKYTHKDPKRSRGTLRRTRVKVNGEKINLHKLAARRKLKLKK